MMLTPLVGISTWWSRRSELDINVPTFDMMDLCVVDMGLLHDDSEDYNHAREQLWAIKRGLA